MGKTKEVIKVSFILNKKTEDLFADNLFYAFVRLNDFEKLPDIWIVLSKVVAENVKYVHTEWLKIPRKDGGKHKDNNMRSPFISIDSIIS